ncbi:hypothetical protein DESC_610145 [Desulfosarcina cetonica]|nr:hypothetical protein DESC_610145 [Desulfosarcina cetonica]
MIKKPIPIKNHFLDTFFHCPLSQQFTGKNRFSNLAVEFRLFLDGFFVAASGHNGGAGRIVDNLSVDVLTAPEYCQARSLGGTDNLFTNPDFSFEPDSLFFLC